MAEVAKVYAAVAEVSRALGREGIGKRSSQGLKFAYRSIEDVLAALNPLLHANHLMIFPERIDREEDQTFTTKKYDKETVQRLVRATITYRFVSTEDGSSFIAQSLGEGLDTSDKAAGKAMSYAYKNLMFQTFCIPVVGMPDPDADQNTEIAVAPAKAVQPKTTKPAPILPYRDKQELLEVARSVAMTGMEKYREYFEKGLANEDRAWLRNNGYHNELKQTADQADNAKSYSAAFTAEEAPV